MVECCLNVTSVTAPQLFGPFPLLPERIDKHLQANSPGVYALGELVNGSFVSRVVGRADDDLRTALKTHLTGPQKHFMFSYAMSPQDAFIKECRLFHSLAILHHAHPTPPQGSGLRCPVCARTEHSGSD